MRRLIVLGVLLGGSCVYLEDANFAPEVTLGVTGFVLQYYRGVPITVVADVEDRNEEDRGQHILTWKLTDDRDEALPEGAASECTPAQSGCFVPHSLDVVYRMTVTATDPQGAVGTASRDFALANRPPEAMLEVRGAQRPNGHYPILVPIQLTPIGSSDPDREDLCGLHYEFALLDLPLESNSAKLGFGPCAEGDRRPGCAEPVTTYCMTPDVAGTYRVQLTVSDPQGLTDETPAEATIEVDPDQPPCLTHLSPAPVARLFVSRAADSPYLLGVSVEDDLDPFPPTADNEPGFPAFTWSIRGPEDDLPVAMPDYGRSYYAVDLSYYSAGAEVQVRLDVTDRVGDRAPCDPSSPVCPAGAGPLAGDCVQRVTWTLEVY